MSQHYYKDQIEYYAEKHLIQVFISKLNLLNFLYLFNRLTVSVSYIPGPPLRFGIAKVNGGLY